MTKPTLLILALSFCISDTNYARTNDGKDDCAITTSLKVINPSQAKANAATLTSELQWLSKVIEARMKMYFGNSSDNATIYEIKPPDLSRDTSLYAKFQKQHRTTFEERIILLLALTPHVQPQLLDMFFTKNSTYDRAFTEFGGIRGIQHQGFIPTGQTACFILAGNDLEKRFQIMKYFKQDHFFSRLKVLKLGAVLNNEPSLSGVLNLQVEFQDYFTNG